MAKTMIRAGWIGMLLGVFTACIEHRPNENRTKGNSDTEQAFIAEKKYKGLRIYEGTIPCADCSGIQQRLVLKGDTAGIYRLTEIYKDATEDGDAEITSSGEWKIYFTDKRRKDKRFYLSQGDIKDSVRVINYEVKPDQITQLDMEGKAIQSNLSYRLKLIRYKAD